MKKKIIKITLLLSIVILLWIVICHNKHKENTIIYISSQRTEIKIDSVKLFIDNKLIDTISLKKHYDLNIYVYKKDLKFGKHLVELKSLDNQNYFKKNSFYFGLVNWIVIGYYDEGLFSYNRFFNKPMLL